MWFLITKILKQKSIQIRTLFYNFLDTPDTIKLLARLLPNLQEANADCAHAPTLGAAPRARRRRRACACRRYGLQG